MANTVHPRFLEYLQKQFLLSSEEITQYKDAACRPLKKTIRINTKKISVAEFQKITQKQGWTLTPTPGADTVFYVDREDTETPLGLTPEHLTGLFYIQEASASSSPFLLGNTLKKAKKSPALLLDMSASPGGKTTQLSEIFPHAFIVANDPSKDRLPQLFENLERMQCLNVGVTNYDARFFGKFPETFDSILLDAPCSGEGTAYKATGALQHWHIKNAKSISRLQEQLLHAATSALKKTGLIAYSTCTLNHIENEGVVDGVVEKRPELQNLFLGPDNGFWRFWPHRQKTGGFFAAILKKTASAKDENLSPPLQPSTIVPLSEKNKKIVLSFFHKHFDLDLSSFFFYGRRNEVCMTNTDISDILGTFFFYRVGVEIGTVEDGEFIPNHAIGTLFECPKNTQEITPEVMERYFRGENIAIKKTKSPYINLSCGHIRCGIAPAHGDMAINSFPKKLLRS